MLKYKKYIFFGLVILLLIIRFLYILKTPLYLDEGIYINWADLFNQSKDFAYLSLQDGKTPLFYWLVSFTKPIFNNYLLSGRLISIFAGLITIICWMVIFYVFFDSKKSIIFLFLSLIAPYGFFVERLALTDSLLMCFANISLMFLLLSKKILEGNKSLRKVIFIFYMLFSGLFLGMAYATKTTTRLFFVTYLLISLFWILNYFKNIKVKNIILMFFGLFVLTLVYNEIINLFRVGGHIFWNSISEKEKLMIYSPKEILARLTNNPWSAFNYLDLIIEYWISYLSGLMVFVFIGTFKLISDIKNHKFLWLLFYWVCVTLAISLSGKVMASRYIYATYSVMLAIAVFGIDYLLSLKMVKIKIFVYLLMLLVLFQSLFFVFKPERAIYSKDDRSYFVSSSLTALGLPKVIEYFENKDKSKILVGVCGTWGVPEGSSVLLKQSGIKSEIINVNSIITSKPTINNKCEKRWIYKNESCWKIDFGFDDKSDTVRYLFIAGDDIWVEKLVELGVEKIYEFDRYKGLTKNYFLKMPTN